jgi:hypothetical protein
MDNRIKGISGYKDLTFSKCHMDTTQKDFRLMGFYRSVMYKTVQYVALQNKFCAVKQLALS